MASDGFTRPVETVDQALHAVSERRARAVAARDQALTVAAKADRDSITYESHVARYDEELTRLLDERLRSRASETVSAG